MTRRASPWAVVAIGLAVAGCGHTNAASRTTTTAAKQAKGPPPPTIRFVSRPDLTPPPVKILTRAHDTAPGLIFLAPKMKVVQAGPEILDNNGQVVWFHPLSTHGVSDFKVQHYRGKPVLTWWRGRAPMGVGSGYYAIYNNRYRQIAQVRAGNRLTGDIHEFEITPDGKALFTVYHQLHVDLTPYGGPKEGRIFDGIVQEVDIPTGRVLFEWHSYPEVGLSESYVPPPEKSAGKKAAPWDYFHVNSIDAEPNGNFLISARNTHAIYELSRSTKKIVWRLGGKKSDFKMGQGTNFEWQHDARRQADGTITLFDNGAAPPVEKFTRILRLRVDPATKRATLLKSFHHPRKLLRGTRRCSRTATFSSAGAASPTSRSSTRTDACSSTRASASSRAASPVRTRMQTRTVRSASSGTDTRPTSRPSPRSDTRHMSAGTAPPRCGSGSSSPTDNPERRARNAGSRPRCRCRTERSGSPCAP